MTEAGGGPQIGTILGGRYRIVEKLGEGAMGAVYLAEHMKIGRRDAIKVLRESLARDPDSIARFTRGARIVSSVNHPNVCAIYDFSDTEDGLHFLAMEYVAGESLKDLLTREGRLPLERAAHIARQVAGALDAAHDVGIIHRDLKPGNIMLVRARDGRDLVKVVDFDIAKGPEGGDEVTRLGFVVGTPEYMSPEQLMGERLDGRSDVYSLALVLFRMLTGVLPFRAESTQDVMIQRLTHAPLALEEAAPDIAFPAPLGALLAHALERRPQDRIASAEEFGRALAAALPQAGGAPPAPAPRAAAATSAAAPVGAQDVPRTRVSAVPLAGAPERPEPAPPARRKPALLAAVIAILVLGAAGAGWVLLHDGAAVADAGTQSGASPEVADRAPPQTSGGAVQPPDSATGAPAAVEPQRGGGAGPAPRTDPAPGAGVVDDPRPRVVVDAGQANAILFQQLELFDLGPPAARTLQAVIDTAGAVWEMRSLPARDRALAAYVLGTAYDARTDWTRCWQWVDSALVLQPGGAGYADLRNKCRALGR